MLLEQFVMRELDGLYTAANQLFIEAGVLPHLKYSSTQAQLARTQLSDKKTTLSAPAITNNKLSAPSQSLESATSNQSHNTKYNNHTCDSESNCSQCFFGCS